MRVIFLFFLLTALCDAEDSCPSVKIVGVGDSDKLTILRGCPGMHGFPGPKGDTGAPGEKGEKGAFGIPGKMGPTGHKGEKGESGIRGETGLPGAQGIKGPSGERGQPGVVGQKGENGSSGVKGEPGVAGAQGQKGEKGEKGDPSHPTYEAAKNCKDLQDRGVVLTGWYTIYPDGMNPLMVLCDMHTDGGGWIVFQRRVDGSVDFFLDWQAYKTGFGSQLSEFWLGNENIHRLTATGSYELRVDLQDFDYNITHAKYNGFKLEGEKDLYRLRLKSFQGGTTGDSLKNHKDKAFTTKDRDNDTAEKVNCAELYSGAWWYNSCHDSNLNGLYLRGEHKKKGKSVQWSSFRNSFYSLKVSEMKFRPEK